MDLSTLSMEDLQQKIKENEAIAEGAAPEERTMSFDEYVDPTHCCALFACISNGYTFHGVFAIPTTTMIERSKT